MIKNTDRRDDGHHVNGFQDPSLTAQLFDANAQRRKLSIDHHDQLRREMLGGLMDERDFDEIDEAMAMPDPPQKRSERATNHVLKILDQLERGNRR